MENPIKMDDFGGTPIFGNTHIFNQSWPNELITETIYSIDFLYTNDRFT